MADSTPGPTGLPIHEPVPYRVHLRVPANTALNTPPVEHTATVSAYNVVEAVLSVVLQVGGLGLSTDGVVVMGVQPDLPAWLAQQVVLRAMTLALGRSEQAKGGADAAEGKS